MQWYLYTTGMGSNEVDLFDVSMNVQNDVTIIKIATCRLNGKKWMAKKIELRPKVLSFVGFIY